MSLTRRSKNNPARADLIWRLDDENPSHEMEREMLQELGYVNFVVTRSSSFTKDYPRYAPHARGVLLQISFPKLGAEQIRGLTSCRVISVTGGGFNNVDVDAATEQGIMVTFVPGYCLEEVSNHALALLLALNRRLPDCQNITRKGSWEAMGLGPIRRLKGQVLGVIGFGMIGRAVARKAKCLGLRIKVYDPYVSESDVGGLAVQFASFKDLVRTSDYISLHVPLTEKTHHLFNEETLKHMKGTAYLINTCRGQVVDEVALIKALETRKIAGAGLDVLAQEPPQPGNPLLSMPNVIVTPHSAYVSQEARIEGKSRAIRAVADALEGRVPEDIINSAVLGRGATSVNTSRGSGAGNPS